MKIKTAIIGLIFLFLIWIAPAFIFIRLNEVLRLPRFEFLPLKIIGLILFISVLCMDVYLFLLFKIYGKGTPVPLEPSKKLVMEGPYKRTINPMYLGHLAVYLSFFMYFGHISLLFLFVIAFLLLHALVTKWEEPGLKARLGRKYIEYTNRVPLRFENEMHHLR